MERGFEWIKQKTQKIAASIEEYGVIVGEKDERINIPTLCGYAPGIGMESDAKNYEKIAKDIQKGIFKVLAMGQFKSGKSTLLNSMIGFKAVPTSAIACTAIITVIVYNKNSNRTLVYIKDRAEPIEMDPIVFNEKYRLTPEDEDTIEKQGYLDRFADVEYAMIESDYSLCQNGVRLIDSPGLGEADTRTKTTLGFVPSANAIIFLLNATVLFSKDEKNYIKNNFANKQLKNIFFVVNRINQLNDDISTIYESVRYHLKEVFKKEDGTFDEELYKKRVFFINAYGALEGKQNSDYEKLNSSGVPEFEKELERFLTTDDRVIATFQSSLNAMANSYIKAQSIIDNTKSAMQAPLSELEKRHAESETVLERIDDEIKSLKKTFDATQVLVQSKIYHSLLAYISNMERAWEADCQMIEAKVDLKDMLKLAWNFKNKEKQEQILAPLAEAIKNYITEKMEEWGKQTGTLIEPEIEALNEELKQHIIQFDMQLDEAAKIFAGKLKSKGSIDDENKVNSIQLILSFLQGDISVLVENAAGGKFTWGEFIKKFIVQAIIANIIFGLFTGGIGWIVFIAVEAIQGIIGAGRLTEKFLQGMKEKLFIGLREGIEGNRCELESNIAAEFNRQFLQISKGMQSQIDEERQRQKKIIQDKKKQESNVELEGKRLDANLNRMLELMREAYLEIYGRNMEDSEINKIATKSIEDHVEAAI